MKKSVSILLLITFTFYTVGGFLIFHVQDFLNYYSNIHYNKSKSVVLCFQKSEKLLYLKNGNEIRVGDELYDIVSKRETEQSIYITCVHDGAEKHLLSSLKNYITLNFGNKTSPGHSSKTISFSLIKDYLPENFKLKFCMTLTKEFSDTHSCSLLENNFEIITPPPQVS